MIPAKRHSQTTLRASQPRWPGDPDPDMEKDGCAEAVDTIHLYFFTLMKMVR